MVIRVFHDVKETPKQQNMALPTNFYYSLLFFSFGLCVFLNIELDNSNRPTTMW